MNVLGLGLLKPGVGTFQTTNARRANGRPGKAGGQGGAGSQYEASFYGCVRPCALWAANS